MSLSINNRIFAQDAGLLADLEQAITKEEVRKLERLGYIENAISPNGETWKLSKKGRQARKLLSEERSIFDRISDFILRKIIRVSI